MTLKTFLKTVPLALLALVAFGCGGGSGGTADPKEIADSAVKMILAKDFDSVYDLCDPSAIDLDAAKEVRDWRVKEGYDTWKQFKKELEGDQGTDPKSKSGIDGEDKWKEMTYGKKIALNWGLYKLYAKDDLDKRLGEMRWAMVGKEVKLSQEGQGSAEFAYANGYGDMIEIKCERTNGLWYLSKLTVSMEKEVPKKPKDE